MSFELFQQGPEVYVPILLISLVITVLAYGSFPFIFALTRNTTITKKKYRRLCFGINVVVMFIFIALNGASNVAPYLLWTGVFSSCGIKILISRGIIPDEDYLPDDPDRLTECKSCGYRDKKFFNACPKCGKHTKQYVYLNDEPTAPINKSYFCKKCGAKLIDNSEFCRKCSVKAVEKTATVMSSDNAGASYISSTNKKNTVLMVIIVVLAILLAATIAAAILIISKLSSKNDNTSSQQESEYYSFEDYTSDYYAYNNYDDYNSEPIIIIPNTPQSIYTPSTSTYIPSHSSYAQSQTEDTCIEGGCDNGVDDFDNYCYAHNCSESYCKREKESGSNYCSSHECMYPLCNNRRDGYGMYCYLHDD